MNEIQEAIFFAEHKLRETIAKRGGMRPGRAIRRLWPGLTDAQVTSLAQAWDGVEFGVTVGKDPALWVKAYRDVTSCMHGFGDLCEKAYTPHGVKIAALVRGGKITARALVRGFATPKAYGEDHHKLLAVLLVAGVSQRRGWLDGVDTWAVSAKRPAPKSGASLTRREIGLRRTAALTDRDFDRLTAHAKRAADSPMAATFGVRDISIRGMARDFWTGRQLTVVEYTTTHRPIASTLAAFRPYIDG